MVDIAVLVAAVLAISGVFSGNGDFADGNEMSDGLEDGRLGAGTSFCEGTDAREGVSVVVGVDGDGVEDTTGGCALALREIPCAVYVDFAHVLSPGRMGTLKVAILDRPRHCTANPRNSLESSHSALVFVISVSIGLPQPFLFDWKLRYP